MKAERAKIAKENRSAGEVEAKRIIAEADTRRAASTPTLPDRPSASRPRPMPRLRGPTLQPTGRIRNSTNSPDLAGLRQVAG